MKVQPEVSSSEQAGLERVADAALPTVFGEFRIAAFSPDEHGKEHVAIYRGELDGAEDVPVRVHSECLTGDVMGSLRCDCRQQLHKALQHFATEPKGILLYMRQEGRGIGLANKVKAYALQEKGLDTVDANHALGFKDDEREYHAAAEMLKALGVKSVRLLTNNPRKVEGLLSNGIKVVQRETHAVKANTYNRDYLQTKRDRSGHIIPGDILDLVAAV